MIPEAPRGTPFDDIRRLITTMPGPDEAAVEAVRERERQLTKPAGSLGRLEWLVEWLAAWQGKAPPSGRPSAGLRLRRRATASPRAASPPIRPTSTGRCSRISPPAAPRSTRSAPSFDLGFKVFDLALDMPTDDIVAEAAMDEKACVATMAFGMEAIAGGTDLLAVGEMGIGNTTVAAAIYAALYGGAGRATGSGAAPGSTMTGSRARSRRSRRALARHAGPSRRSARGAAPARRPRGRGDRRRDPRGAPAAHPRDARRLRGDAPPRRCCTRSIPPRIDHCIAGHLSAEGAHREVLERLGKIPLLALGMRLGEGTGAALAAGLVRAAAALPPRHGDVRGGGGVGARTRTPRGRPQTAPPLPPRAVGTAGSASHDARRPGR